MWVGLCKSKYFYKSKSDSLRSGTPCKDLDRRGCSGTGRCDHLRDKTRTHIVGDAKSGEWVTTPTEEVNRRGRRGEMNILNR